MPSNHMNSDKMLIRMAKAIAGVQGAADWQEMLPAARAALLAMREPTIPMLEAAMADLPDWGNLPEDWRVMIDHAARELPH